MNTISRARSKTYYQINKQAILPVMLNSFQHLAPLLFQQYETLKQVQDDKHSIFSSV